MRWVMTDPRYGLAEQAPPFGRSGDHRDDSGKATGRNGAYSRDALLPAQPAALCGQFGEAFRSQWGDTNRVHWVLIWLIPATSV